MTRAIVPGEAVVAQQSAAPQARTKRLLMSPPVHFDVVYRINPWMDPEHAAADRGVACEQWQRLRGAYERAGHRVDTIAPSPGLPDMVFAANAALVIDGVAYLAKFRHGERRGEEVLYERWFRAHGYAVVRASHVHEGEGDFALDGDIVLAGTGFRTDVEAHHEVAQIFGREVVTLELVDPRFYHLDTALFVLAPGEIAYYPAAFSATTQAELRRRYPDAVVATDRDALAFGCNAASDGRRVFLPAGADDLGEAIAARGYEPIPVDLSELRKAGGSVKCCTLELRGAR
jgi:N-dimethylarginine dimethylaminohydrolase